MVDPIAEQEKGHPFPLQYQISVVQSVSVKPGLINPGWWIVVVPPNSGFYGYWNGTPQLDSRLGFINPGLTLVEKLWDKYDWDNVWTVEELIGKSIRSYLGRPELTNLWEEAWYWKPPCLLGYEAPTSMLKYIRFVVMVRSHGTHHHECMVIPPSSITNGIPNIWV